jgi:urease accessory protein
MMIKKFIYSLPLFGFSTVSLAHPGHALTSLHAGFMHPFMGWDHLLMMIAVGLWACRQGGSSRWQLPTFFVCAMAIGASIGFITITAFPAIEATIAIGLVMMGIFLFTYQSISKRLAIGFVSVIGLAHGLAHGVELMGQPYAGALAGMLLATGILHMLGYFAGSLHGMMARFIHAVFAMGVLITGGLLLVS